VVVECSGACVRPFGLTWEALTGLKGGTFGTTCESGRLDE
jgi:hypothetical protein